MDAAIGGVANQGGAMLRLLAQAGQRLIGAAVVAIKPKHQRIWSGHRILVVSKPEPDGNPVRSTWIYVGMASKPSSGNDKSAQKPPARRKSPSLTMFGCEHMRNLRGEPGKIKAIGVSKKEGRLGRFR
jgi:hypothetical protein